MEQHHVEFTSWARGMGPDANRNVHDPHTHLTAFIQVLSRSSLQARIIRRIRQVLQSPSMTGTRGILHRVPIGRMVTSDARNDMPMPVGFRILPSNVNNAISTPATALKTFIRNIVSRSGRLRLWIVTEPVWSRFYVYGRPKCGINCELSGHKLVM